MPCRKLSKKFNTHSESAFEGLSNPVTIDNIDSETAIIEKGVGLDSVALLEFVVGLENEFGHLAG